MLHGRDRRSLRGWVIGLTLASMSAPAHAQQTEDVDGAAPFLGSAPDGAAPFLGSAPDGAERDGSGRGDTGAAESLVRVARGLMELGQYDEACAKLEQAMQAGPSGPIAMLLGSCLERQGKLASAWAAYRQAVTRLKNDGGEALAHARQGVQRVEPQVPKLTIRAADPLPDMVILRNDTEFGIGVLEVPLAVDPGRHTLVASAKGYRRWTTDIDVKASERLSVTIPPLEKLSETAARSSVTRADPGAWFTAGVITTGVGIAALAVGGILGAVAARDVHRAEVDATLCPSRVCTPAGREAIDAADAKAIGASVMFGAGGVLVATGIALLVVDATTGSGEVAASLVPLVAPDGGALLIRVGM